MSRAQVWVALAGAAALAACGGSVQSSGGTGGTGGDVDGGGSGGTGAVAGTSGGGSGGTAATAGTGASAGTAGIAGASGSGGSVADSGPDCFGSLPPPPACGVALCGNGAIDSCNDCPDGGWGGYPGGGPGGPPCTSNAEACDGIELAGASCASLGFYGGTLACTSGCAYDTGGCQRCAPLGAHLTACQESIGQASRVTALDVASTATEVGVAWVAQNGFYFARLAADFSLIGRTALPVAACAPLSIAVAARPGGWEVAISGYNYGVQLVALDATGKVVKSTQFSTTGHAATFGQRPGGTPLLAWLENQNQLRAAVVSSDGASTTPPTTFALPGSTVDGFLSAASTVNAFLVAVRAGNRVVVGRVEHDGTSTGAVTTPVPDLTEVPALAGSSGDARLVYENFGVTPIGVHLVRLDTAGNALGTPMAVGTAPDYYNNAYPIAVGPDTVVVMGNYTGGVYLARHLDAVRVDAAGAKLWGPVTIATDPQNITGYRTTLFGSDVVTAYVESNGNIGAARLVP